MTKRTLWEPTALALLACATLLTQWGIFFDERFPALYGFLHLIAFGLFGATIIHMVMKPGGGRILPHILSALASVIITGAILLTHPVWPEQTQNVVGFLLDAVCGGLAAMIAVWIWFLEWRSQTDLTHFDQIRRAANGP